MLPVSDDGGSTAEIVRVLGGPAVGDIRSRCLRLADDTSAEVGAGWDHIKLACRSSTCVPGAAANYSRYQQEHFTSVPPAGICSASFAAALMLQQCVPAHSAL